MTSQPIQPAESTSTRVQQRTPVVRFLILGIVLLGVTVMNLHTNVEDWSTAASSGFIGNHATALIGAAIGLALVVTGIVKYVRR